MPPFRHFLIAVVLMFLPMAEIIAADPARPKTAEATIAKQAWSFDRSHLDWCPWSKPGEQKAKGTLDGVAGWTEYDFEIPANGWYELYSACVWGWCRDIYVDGRLLFYLSCTSHEDLLKDGKQEWTKEANLWLQKGKHSLRFRRTSFPPCLPSAWMLKPGGENPAASIRAGAAGPNVQRAGDNIRMSFLGGMPAAATSYDLQLKNTESGETTPAGKLEFPATEVPVERAIEICFPKQGQFLLVGKSGARLLRPADLKAGRFVIIDTKNPPPPAAELKTTPVIDVDCVKGTINGHALAAGKNYFENRCHTEIVAKGGLTYRELIPNGPSPQDKLSPTGDRDYALWGCEAFAYKFDLPDKDHVYRVLVDYPDDDRRTMGFHLQDFPEQKGGWIQTGGVETGDHYPLTHSLLTHEAYFFCRETKGLVLAVVNLMPGWKAAAARIRIERVEDGLPAAPGVSNGRLMGFYFEEPGRWHSYFGGEPGKEDSDMLPGIEAMERWARWNRYLGANLLFPTVMVYNGVMWPSLAADGWACISPENTPRMLALVAEKYGQKFVPEIHVSGSEQFEKNQFGLAYDEKSKRIVTLRTNADEVIIRDLDGSAEIAWRPYCFNALHPKVQAKYIELVGELADQLKDSPAFAGISCRLMLDWQWAGFNALPGLKYGYDDFTVSLFEKETGVKVPATQDGPRRFRQRFDFLTGPQRERWLAWRCGKIFDLHERLLRRIREANPQAKLFLPYFGPSTKSVLATDTLGQMREIGMDPAQYAAEPGIVVIQGGMYGRRYSTPLGDAQAIEPLLYDPQAIEIAKWGGRGRCLYTSYFEYGKSADFDRLGGKDVFVNDCCTPSGVNELELYAMALADGDASFLINGGAGWMFGTPRLMQPFLARASCPSRSPVPALGQGTRSGGDMVSPSGQPHSSCAPRDEIHHAERGEYATRTSAFVFYAVNRLPVPVSVAISVQGQGATLKSPADGKPIALRNGRLCFTLAPYMLKAFVSESRDFGLAACKCSVPAEFVEKIKPEVASAKILRADLAARRRAPDLSENDASEAIRILGEAVDGFAKGEYWKAWRIDRLPVVKACCVDGRFPPGMWDRSIRHGMVDKKDAPKLEPMGEKGVFGDVRGHLGSCIGIGKAPNGGFWAASENQAMHFDADGTYVSATQFFVPLVLNGDRRLYAMSIQSLLHACTFATLQDGRLGARDWPNPLYVYSPPLARYRQPPEGQGFPMVHPAAVLATGRDDSLYVAWNGNEGSVRKFKSDCSAAFDFGSNPPTNVITDSGANGGAIDLQGRIYVSPLDGGLKVYSPQGLQVESVRGAAASSVPWWSPPMARRCWRPRDRTLWPSAANRAVSWRKRGPTICRPTSRRWPYSTTAALSPDSRRKIAKARSCVLYNVSAKGLVPKAIAAKGLGAIEPECLNGFTQLKAAHGLIFYAAHKKIWSLAPGAERRGWSTIRNGPANSGNSRPLPSRPTETSTWPRTGREAAGRRYLPCPQERLGL